MEEKERLRSYIRWQYGFFEYGIWGIYLKSSGELIGKAGVENAKWDENQLAFGYMIGENWQRKGYGREACVAVLQYVRENISCGRLAAMIDKQNLPSLRFAESLGFGGQLELIYEGKERYLLYLDIEE